MPQAGLISRLCGRIRPRLSALWAYRGFVLGSVKREFQARYRNSLFGAAWTVLNPLAMILIYTLVFSQVMRARLPGVDSSFAYSIFLMAGLLPWGLFTETLSRYQNMFLENANLIKKVSFPKLCLPLIGLLNSLVNFAIIFALFLVFLLLSGNFPGWVALSFIPLLLLQIFFTVGLGMLLGILNVFFRDVGQFFPIFLQFWFWLTPIIYAVDIVPEAFRAPLTLNPLLPLFSAYQGIFVRGLWPELSTLMPLFIVSIFINLLAFRLFRKRAGEMVDEL